MLKHFDARWDSVPVAFIDTETTGIRPGIDRAVQIGIARFEDGKCRYSWRALLNPGIPIPAEATAVHGITDEMVRDAPSIEELFRSGVAPSPKSLLEGAQPAAYNAPFDRHFVPPFGDDWTWPWLDTLSLVRVVDRFERGKGRHRLEAAAKRHGVSLPKAHDAGDDARAAGELFYRLVPRAFPGSTLGALLKWQRDREAEEWFRFSQWLSQQPPREKSVNG